MHRALRIRAHPLYPRYISTPFDGESTSPRQAHLSHHANHTASSCPTHCLPRPRRKEEYVRYESDGIPAAACLYTVETAKAAAATCHIGVTAEAMSKEERGAATFAGFKGASRRPLPAGQGDTSGRRLGDRNVCRSHFRSEKEAIREPRERRVSRKERAT